MQMDGEDILTCPRRWIKDEPEASTNCFWLYRRYDKGQLPEDGGLQSQPSKLMQVFRVMEIGWHRVEDEREKKRDRKSAVAASKRSARPMMNAKRTSPVGRGKR